ncbi:Ig-like domain-containing protein [Parafrigoribacterium soli]|uniref:Ig-like domain-containing protein n=1 Tax=Parafrigoribacterium soli TaxID=3144663 RepID=UPI0032EF6F5F
MFRRWLSTRTSLLVTVVSAVIVGVLVVAVAIVSNGYTAQHLDLNDGSVWVSNGAKQVIGRANTQVLELNTVVASTGVELNVVQDDSAVLLVDESDSKVDIVDPATSKVTDSVPLPSGKPEVFLAHGQVVIHSRATGELWIMPFGSLPKFDAESQPTLSLGTDSVVSMTPEGVLYAYSAEAAQVYRVDVSQSDAVTQTTAVPGFGNARSVMSITSVADTWALLDATSRKLLVGGRTVDLTRFIRSDTAPALQHAAAAGNAVLIANRDGLISVPLAGGDPQSLVSGRSGFAAAPTVVNGCAFGAWSDGTAWRRCGEGAATTLLLRRVPAAAARLEFLSNGDRVVLNDPRGGGSWAVQQDGELIDNWADLIVVKQDQRQVEQNDEDTPPEYEKTQVPPVAVADDFGARPGRSSVLPVLLNDYDPNGDVLVVSSVTPIDESVGRLDLINNQQQVQLTLAPTASAPISFEYTVSDGRGGSATAIVTVTVRTPGENSAPVQVRHTRALVAQGGRVTTPVLGDWVDPDGDAFYLSGASTSEPDTVSYKPEGTVVFTEGGAASGLRSVTLTVSDGTASGTGNVAVTVKPVGKVPILADPFVVLSYAGQETTVSPLDHVRGGTGVLRLASVPSKAGATITPSLETGTFRFTSDTPGTYYVDYVVNDGDQTANGVVRIDVAAPPDANTKPITIPKTIFVTSLGTQTVDVATTDIDPAGGVLLATRIANLPEASGVRAEILDQSTVRVTLTAPLEAGPVRFNYWVTNGLAEAEGVITVVEIPELARLQPPIANDDNATARVGDVINIPVLANDVQPDGKELTLKPQLSTALSGSSGLLFASGDVLRYLAPSRPGNFTAVYEVAGPDGQVAQAQVHIAVREAVQATNSPPAPLTVTGRVVAGETVRIKIPLGGTDPDGDSVQLLGQATNPQKGSVTTVGTDYMDYEAGSYSAGTDTFTYTVIDSLGARATGTVRVGISPKAEGARNPVATQDDVLVRPGRTVSVRVLDNDSDPDGGLLTVTSVKPNGSDVTANIVDDYVRVTPPKTPGRYGLVYTIENRYGGTASAFITVTVDPNAPRAYPIASDTVLTLSDILGQDSVNVDVLKNVFFADGAPSELNVSIMPGYGSSASVIAGKRVRVAIGQKSQIIPFAVANPDDSSIVSYAFIWVPGLNDALPQINRKAPPLQVRSESTLTIDLNDYVVAVDGKRVRLTGSSTVQATHANGDNLVVNDHTLSFTSSSKYFGPASISFEVTDGSSATDPDGRKATLVLPITVTPRQNQPPVFNGGVIEFEPGQSKHLDLLKLTTYPYPKDVDELAYSVLAPLPTGFSYTLTGQKLTIKANENAVSGSTTAIVLGVRDDVTTGQSGRIELDVVASSRPLASAAPDTVTVPRGQTKTVDVLANDEATNPFPGQPLRVVAIRGLDGNAIPAGLHVAPNADKSRLTVTADQSAKPGDTSLQYQVADVTGDPNRYVWGTVTISVQDRPDAPTGVQELSFGDGVVRIAWTAAQFNNSPIIGYDVTTVRADTGAVFGKTRCLVTSGCDIPTPGNGPDDAVRISVTATNGIGESDPGSLGRTVWSDVLPAAPASITATATNSAPGGGSVRVNWTTVPTPAHGSAVVGYTVLIGGMSVDVGPGQNSYEFLNGGGELATNNTYTVTVIVRNGAQVTSSADWNRGTTSVTTVGPPSQTAGGVTAISDAATGNMQVSWGASDPNGRPSVSYRVNRYNADQAPPTTCPSGGTAGVTSPWTDTTAVDGHSYFYVISADNGLYCTPTVSAKAISQTAPGQASGTASIEDHGGSGQFDVQAGSTASVASGTATRYEYRLNGGGWASVAAGQWLTSAADASVYGTTVTIEYRGCRDATENYCGAASAPIQLVPVNTRASILSCQVGSTPRSSVPLNAGSPVVHWLYSYDDGLGWSSYVEDAPAPPPAVAGGTTSVRVKAVVEIGPPPYYTDPGYGEGTCTT